MDERTQVFDRRGRPIQSGSRAGKEMLRECLVEGRCFQHPICPDILRIFDSEQISKAGPGSVDPTFDRPNPCSTDGSSLLVREPLCSYKQEGLALVDGKLGQSSLEVLYIEMCVLLRRDSKA